MSTKGTAKFLRKMKGTISKLAAEKEDLKKRIGSVQALEADKQSLLSTSDAMAMEIVQSKSTLLAVRKELDDVRDALRHATDQNGILHHKLNEVTQALLIKTDLHKEDREENKKLHQKIKELKSDDRNVAKLQRRLREAHQDVMVLVRQLRGQGQEPVRRPRMTTQEAAEAIPEGGVVEHVDPSLEGQPGYEFTSTGRMVSEENLQEIPKTGTQTGRLRASDPHFSNVPPEEKRK